MRASAFRCSVYSLLLDVVKCCELATARGMLIMTGKKHEYEFEKLCMYEGRVGVFSDWLITLHAGELSQVRGLLPVGAVVFGFCDDVQRLKAR